MNSRRLLLLNEASRLHPLSIAHAELLGRGYEQIFVDIAEGMHLLTRDVPLKEWFKIPSLEITHTHSPSTQLSVPYLFTARSSALSVSGVHIICLLITPCRMQSKGVRFV